MRDLYKVIDLFDEDAVFSRALATLMYLNYKTLDMRVNSAKYVNMDGKESVYLSLCKSGRIELEHNNIDGETYIHVYDKDGVKKLSELMRKFDNVINSNFDLFEEIINEEVEDAENSK